MRQTLEFRAPFAGDALLQFLAPRATPGVEVVDGSIYRRTIHLDGESGCFQAALESSRLTLDIHIPKKRLFPEITSKVGRLFDLDADPVKIARRLTNDPRLAPLVAASPGLRLPGAWDGFELAIRAVLGQQVTVRGATTLAGRLARSFGTAITIDGSLTHIFPTPPALAEADVGRIGLPQARANTIRSLARAVCDGKLSFSDIPDVEAWKSRFCKLPGIGRWTAEYVAMRALGDRDAFPASDLGLLRALKLSHPREAEARSQAWRPWRAYAAIYLWHSAAAQQPARPPRLSTVLQ